MHNRTHDPMASMVMMVMLQGFKQSPGTAHPQDLSVVECPLRAEQQLVQIADKLGEVDERNRKDLFSPRHDWSRTGK